MHSDASRPLEYDDRHKTLDGAAALDHNVKN